jgi:hypothetical protein
MVHEIAWAGIILVFLTGCFLLFLQIRTYRRTGHRSLLVAATGQIFGLIYGLVQVAPYAVALSKQSRWTLFYLASACLYVECVVGALGAYLIFRAFEQALARARSAPPPFANRRADGVSDS